MIARLRLPKILGSSTAWGRDSLGRRAWRAFFLAAYALTCLGIPVPGPNHRAPKGVRYPCEGRSCGCANAEQCWRSCHCSTLQEKIAWARANNVEIPPYVQELVAQQKDDAPCPCCCKKPTTATQSNPCCPPTAPNRPAAGSRCILLIDALGCRGHTGAWMAAFWGLPLPLVQVADPRNEPCGAVFPRPPDILISQATAPPDRPPRSFS